MDLPASLSAALAADPVPQAAFPWSREAWAPVAEDLDGGSELLDSLPDAVDRESTRDVVARELVVGHTLRAFLAVMVWGWGATGNGPLRTRWILTGVGRKDALDHPVRSGVAPRLTKAAELVGERGPVEACRYLLNEGAIKHFKMSYVTKWLYFASARGGLDDSRVAPILDARVAEWFASECGTILDLNRTDTYARYVRTLTEWGGETRTPAQVELAIVELTRQG